MTQDSNIPKSTDDPQADYGRKPYAIGSSDEELLFSSKLRGAEGDGTYRSMLGRTPYSVMERQLAQYIEHSSFKKPYLGDDSFPDMEEFADLMGFDPTNPPWNIAGDGEFTGGGTGELWDVCQIEVTYLGSVEDNCGTVIFYFQTDVGGGYEVYVESSTHPISRSVDNGTFVNYGSPSNLKFTLTHPKSEEWTVTFRQPMWVGLGIGEGPESQFCRKTVTGSCESTCDISWDDSTSDDTIIRNGTATVAISDTLSGATYSWSVSGTGYTLDNATTTVLTNTLNADGTACGSATITVTCPEGSATGYVRCTTGTWVNATPDILCFTGQGSETYRSSEIVGNLRYDTYWHCTENSEDPIPPYDSCGSIGDCSEEPFAIRTAAVIRIKEWVC